MKSRNAISHILANVLLLFTRPKQRYEKPRTDRRPQRVAGYLLLDEFVVWFVVVKRLDNPVTIMPHIGAFTIRFKTSRVAVTNQVQPKGCQTFAVARAFQHFVYQQLPRIGTVV